MKLIIAAALLLPITAAAEAPPSPAAMPVKAQDVEAPIPPGWSAMPNPIRTGSPNCPSFARQIADEEKSADERAQEVRPLNREPAAHLFLTVDRQIDGCREVTLVRRNVASGSPMPVIGRRRD